MDSAISRSLGFWLVLLSVISIQKTWASKQPQPCVSNCGQILNISHPFRLKGDPERCGERKYELECINNVTVVGLLAGEYQVKAINYNNFTIRLLDPNIQEDNCSSLPRYFLYRYNFSGYASLEEPDDAPYHVFLPIETNGYRELLENIIYLTCKDAVNTDDLYVNTTSCLDQHTYAIDGDLPAYRLKFGCRVKLVATYTSTDGSYGVEPEHVSYTDLHKKLAHGFELSWLHSVCADYGCGSESCYFNETAGKVLCDEKSAPSCHYVYHTTDKCGIWPKFLAYTLDYLKGILIGIGTRSTVTHNKKLLGNYVSYQSFKGGELIGQYVIPSFMAARFLFGVTLLTVILIYKWRRRHLSMYDNIESFLQDNDLSPIRYSYREIKKITGGFKIKLGAGGFGFVYKGKLRSGPFVAIKLLSKSKTDGHDFISEVATIGRIHHVNVVRLIGFCVEGSKRALVYEFMPNGSLDRYIFSKKGTIPLSYEKIHQISLGVANGIAYLHQGCDMRILHFDIKPHNILLDDNFIPKVSDFGLAKLYPVDDSIVSLTAIKGTIGYMAPELFYKNIGGVSYKADVYSFGMLLMEMASKRRNSNPHAEHSSQLYFPLWIYDQFKEDRDIEVESLTEEEKKVTKKMFIVALWCIQLKPCDRPSMSKVVDMLEGELESLEMPPKPSLYPNETFAEDKGSSWSQMMSDESTSSLCHLGEMESDHLLAGE